MISINTRKEISSHDITNLLKILKKRFDENTNRHLNIEWNNVQEKLVNKQDKLYSLNEMEKTGGEPDVIKYDEHTNEYVFCDCSKESPLGRRNVCYDYEALMSRKEYKPENNAIDMATSMGVEILNIEQYRELQKVGEFDTKTSSWIKTNNDIMKLRWCYFWRQKI